MTGLSKIQATLIIQRFCRDYINHWIKCLIVLNKFNYGDKKKSGEYRETNNQSICR